MELTPEEVQAMNPRNNWVLAERSTFAPTSTIIELPQMYNDWAGQRTMNIIKVGPQCVDLKPGDVAILSKSVGVSVEYYKGNHLLIRETMFEAKIEEESE